ncbi:hypothetical protein ACHAWT_002127 [Skeletonema menzelii]
MMEEVSFAGFEMDVAALKAGNTPTESAAFIGSTSGEVAEVPFTGFEVIHPPAGSKDFVTAALKAGKTPTEIAAFVGSTSDEVAAILNISSSSSTRDDMEEESTKQEIEVKASKEEIEMEATKKRVSKRFSPPMSPISSLEFKRYFGEDDDDDGLSIVSAVTTHSVKNVTSVFSHECSVFTEMHLEQDPAIDANSTDPNPLQKGRNRFARKVFKRLPSLSVVPELDASSCSEKSPPIANPKKKQFAKEAFKKLSILRKNAPNEDDESSVASTVASTQASEQSSNISSAQSSMNSSITVSTADFDENPDQSDLDNLAFQSYLFTNPWDAAKAGDYATLNYIVKNEDESDNVWTNKDESGNVPLYYACVFGGNYGKWGLESVKLMLNVWPEGDIPNDLLKLCLKETENKAVKKVLRDKMGRRSAFLEPRRKSSTVVEGTENVTPQSFLDDLGDDGYVEDY